MAADGPLTTSRKSNFIQRSKILSKNDLSITISHSDKGKEIAFSWAADHCGSLGKIAIYAGGVSQFGPDTISTWHCVSPPAQ